ncbi:MAG: ATP-dependent RNA helicase DbpA [Deltaproteobacteria bacterium]|nr:MAG: ATP-dependent RNA helicase DbpA [Deltaproteobacteria bacterium]
MSLSFNNLPLTEELIQVVSELGFSAMTPIQSQSIPALLEGKDLIGQSKTGSGKTAAFTLPILQKIDLKLKKIQALILCPTRELSLQVTREIRKFGRRHAGLKVIILSGGEPIKPQVEALNRGVHIVVGTPGRLLDHLKKPDFDLSHIFCVVLDEADRMLDMGFQKDMEVILKSTPSSRQTVFFSATYPSSIEALSQDYQRNPVRVTINEEKVENKIQHLAYETSHKEKHQRMLDLLHECNPSSALIFCNLKNTVNELILSLQKSGVSAALFHGDLEQNDRNRVMVKFRNQSIRILVAIDVAVRGIDIEKLDMVFNFDLPQSSEVYVHRTGRTGRAGEKGIAVSLLCDYDSIKIDKIETFIGMKIERKTWTSQFRKSLPHFEESKMETLYLSCGRKDKIRPGDILGALTGELGNLQGTDIGKIEIFDRFSYVAISKNVFSEALQRINNGKIKGRKVRAEKVV